MSKKNNATEKELIRVTNKISNAILEDRIPRGEDLRIYFKLYDDYRLRHISHMIPKGSKNLKNRLINFMINDLRMPARVSVDPVQKEYGNSGLNFNKLIMIAIDQHWIVGFHVEEDKHNGLKEIARQLLPNPVNKRAIADFFDAQIAAGNLTVTDYLKNKKHEDYFAKYLVDHNKVNENVFRG